MRADAEPPATAGAAHATPAPGLAWEWTAAALGAVYAVPAAWVILDDLPRGSALSVGVLPPRSWVSHRPGAPAAVSSRSEC